MESCNKCGRWKGKKVHSCTRTSWNKGISWSSEMRKKLSEGQKKSTIGHRFEVGNKAFLGKHHSEETKEKQRISKLGNKYTLGRKRPLAERLRLSETHKGDKCYAWKGGLTQKHLLIRMSLDYRLWREAVFKRDGYCCVWCGKNGKLNADHIKPFSLFPELRLAIDNGRTLCVECHRKTDTYAGRAKKFIKNNQSL